MENALSETLTKSTDVQGVHLVGRDGVKFGGVREMFVDLASGRIAFLIVETAGLLGRSGKFHPVPWATVRFDSVSPRFRPTGRRTTSRRAQATIALSLPTPATLGTSKRLAILRLSQPPLDYFLL
jgi:sporulation protein YlmC with PRC-barrel domain